MHAKLGVLSFDRTDRTDSMVEAFREHCHGGGADFIGYLKDWHLRDALEEIADAANGGYTPIEALKRIRKALEELYEIAADAHRAALEWEGVE